MDLVARPNFFIVGAPKSGTTSLYSYLKRHPDIFMSEIKEPQYFASDILGQQRAIRTLPDYLKCFEECSGERRIGEASTAYLGSPCAPRQIHDFNPQAQIIIMLRNPIDVMHAQHSERVVSHMEHIAEFEGALDSQEVRRWRAGPLKGQPVIRLSYRELASFFRQVERYLTVFGRENVYVIVYDDLKRDTAAAFRNTLQFLGVPIDWTVTGEILNANRRVRSMFLQDFLRHSPPLVQRAKRLLPRTFRKVVRSQVLRFNLIYEPRAPVAPMLRKRLQNEVKPEIDQLSDLLQRDLSGWYGT